MLSGAVLNPDSAIPPHPSVCTGRAKVHRGGIDFRPPTEAALLVFDPGQRLFQFRDQRLDVLHSHMVRDLTRQRLVSRDSLFEFCLPGVLVRSCTVHGGFFRDAFEATGTALAYVAGGGSMSGARGLRSGLKLDSSIWPRRLEALSIRAAASLGSFVACANSTSVAACRTKCRLPITVTFPVVFPSQRRLHYAEGGDSFRPNVQK